MNTLASVLLTIVLLMSMTRLPAESLQTLTPERCAEIYRTITQQLARDSSFFGEPDEPPAKRPLIQNQWGAYFDMDGKALLQIDSNTGKLLFLNNY